MAKDKVWTDKDGQPPQEPDDASAGKTSNKNLPEQPGSGIKVKKMAKGGSASSRADGCATKGKTRGKVL